MGWNAPTRAMVHTEAAALRDLPTGGDLPDSPRLLDSLQWGGRTVTIVEPMPRTVRRLRRPDVPRVAAMLAVARRGGPAAPRRPLDCSPFLANLARRADLAGGAIRGHVTALAHRHGAVEAEFGDWHGDWVPWNLAEHGDRLIAWDWENRGSDVPLGFDLAHQAFQTALSEQRLPAHAAADSMAAALLRYGPALGLGAPQQRMVADAYLIELWLRTADGWRFLLDCGNGRPADPAP